VIIDRRSAEGQGAKALGLAIPPSLRARRTELIPE
jgi:hypothetical protein